MHHSERVRIATSIVYLHMIYTNLRILYKRYREVLEFIAIVSVDMPSRHLHSGRLMPQVNDQGYR